MNEKQKLKDYLKNNIPNNAKYWYQGGIKLPYELETPSDYQDSNCNDIFEIMGFKEGDFEGKIVLDLGCNSGFYAIRAAELGAKEAIGIDLDKQWIEAGKKFIELKKLYNIKLICEDISEFNWANRKYDIIFVNNVIYHLKNPIEFLCKISECCNETLIFYSRFWSQHNPENRNPNFKGFNPFIPTVEEMTFIFRCLGFGELKFDSLKKEWLRELGIGVPLKERFNLPMVTHKISVKANKISRERKY